MFKSDFQHQFWLTKKIVQRKLGDKEDDCVRESDARLDAKIELFRSLSIGGNKMLKIVELYLERLSVLAENEKSFSSFLCEINLCDGLTEKYTKVVGKSISYGSKGRELVKPSLSRLAHELATFNSHAIRDAAGTIDLMEKQRTEYRASLSWMKSASANLDPDSNRAIQKFRKTQQMVKQSKQKFEKLEQDCLEKVDLLVAARSNMFSYVLINYQQALMKSFENTIEVFKSAIEFMKHENKSSLVFYSGSLTKTEIKTEETTKEDCNRMLFFNDEYKDEKVEEKQEEQSEEYANKDDLVLFDSFINDSTELGQDLSFLPSELLQWDNIEKSQPAEASQPILSAIGENTSKKVAKTTKDKKENKSWYDLFAELDPLTDLNNANSLFNSGEAI